MVVQPDDEIGAVVLLPLEHDLDVLLVGEQKGGQGFAAFGRVVKGMDVVKKIQSGPAEGQTLKPPVKILKVMRQP